MSTLSSIIQKWKKCETIRTLSNAGHPAKPSKQARRALVRQVTKNPMVTLRELQRSSTEMGKPARRTTMSEIINQAFVVEWLDRRLSQVRDIWQALKKLWELEEKDVWPDETTELFCLNSKYWQKPGTAHQSKSLYFTKYVTNTRNLSWWVNVYGM